MKIPKVTREHAFIFCLLLFSALLIVAEIRTAATVLKLKENIAEAHAQTEYASSRAGKLTELLGRMQEELERAESVPIALAPSADALAAAIENCATSVGIDCTASVSQEQDEKTALEVTFTATREQFLTFLHELLSRPENFFVTAIESRKTAETRLNVRLRLLAFVKREAA